MPLPPAHAERKRRIPKYCQRFFAPPGGTEPGGCQLPERTDTAPRVRAIRESPLRALTELRFYHKTTESPT